MTLVGDGGMIKTCGIETLQKYGYTYITSIGDAQIKTLLKADVLQISLFDDDLHETTDVTNNIRYITRRNPVMAAEIQKTRASQIQDFTTKATNLVSELNEHPQKHKDIVERTLNTRLKRYHLDTFVSYKISGEKEHHELVISINQEVQTEKEKLDGCYCVKTDIPQDKATKEEVHADYKRLINVENAFRTMKTELLEVRPLYLHMDKRIE